MSKSRFPYVGAVSLFLRKDNQILLLRRINTGRRDGSYTTLAGHMEGNGETPRMAAVREAKEEAGIDISIDNLKFLGVQYLQSNDERLNFYFSCEVRDGEITNMEPEKCDDIKWFDLDALPENIDYPVLFLERCLKGEVYQEERL